MRLTMDVAHLTRTGVDVHNNQANWKAFNQAIGSRASAMEHLVPEQMYSTDKHPAKGISAVKALAIANAQGQKISHYWGQVFDL